MSLGPTIPRDPLKLLEPDETRQQSIISKYYAPVVGGFMGFTGVLVANWGTRRPLLSGIQRHIIFTGAMTYLAVRMDNFRLSLLADRDAILRHYVQLHPDDFPPTEPKKLKDVFEPWYPVR